MSFYDMSHNNNRICITIDSFSTSTHKYNINVHNESDEYEQIPHFHVICTDGEILLPDTLYMLIPRHTGFIDIEEGVDDNVELIPFHKNMDKEIALAIDRNIYISHFTTRYFAGKHPIVEYDPEFIDALNECLRKEINSNGQTNWDYICIMYYNYMVNNSDGWKRFNKEIPTYTENMVLIQQ